MSINNKDNIMRRGGVILSQGMTFGAKRAAVNQQVQQPTTMTFGAKRVATNQQPTMIKFNLEHELNSIEEDKARISNEVQRLAAAFNPADKKTESLESQIKEIVRLTREFWKLNLIRVAIADNKVSRAEYEKVLQEEKILENTTLLGQFMDGWVSIDGYFGNEVFFSLFTARDIVAGFPSDERFSNANELQMQLLLCDVIPYYDEKIVLFGKKLEYLDEYQVGNLTIKQIRAIKNANISFSQGSSIFQKINELTQNECKVQQPTTITFGAKQAAVNQQMPPTEKSKACLLI